MQWVINIDYFPGTSAAKYENVMPCISWFCQYGRGGNGGMQSGERIASIYHLQSRR